ncbi:MAG: hypothetical protein H6555_10395 [Lewinellaceae bacterium]|nr:hypothetical protein [Lewinellaceae bacterium]
MEFIKRFEDRAPVYDMAHRESIIERFSLVGGRDEELKNETGRTFSNVYELYMYAAMLGLKNNYRIPLEGVKTREFNKIKFWQPNELVRFIFMALVARSNVDLNALEELEESEVEREITKLKNLLEEYANGGFDLIHSKTKESPYFFENEYCFLELLES